METEMDWMYKGNQMVNREEYLLGRPVDKAFEQMQQAEKDTELNKAPKNHVEYECIPPSLRFFSGNEQVDLARKMQEDPLYAIKKKEIETRNQLLKNPIKLKHLRELLEQQSSKSKSERKKKKSKQKDSSEDEANLDVLLISKYKQLKNNISEKDLLKSIMKIKHKQRKKSKKRYTDSESESDDKNSKKKKHKRKKQKKHLSDTDSDDTDSHNSSSESDTRHQKRDDKKESNKKIDDDKKQIRKRKTSKDRTLEYQKHKKYEDDTNYVRQRQLNDKRKDGSRNRYSDKKRYSVEEQNDTKISNSSRPFSARSTADTNYTKYKDRREEKYRSKMKSSLTEEDKAKRRQEMMANAVWRDKEREKNVKQYREQEKKEVQTDKSYSKDFIRKQLVVATEVGTVASRIKSNINNIQRSSHAMDTNFAKR